MQTTHDATHKRDTHMSNATDNVTETRTHAEIVAEYRATLTSAFDVRMSYERAKNAENESIQSVLKAQRKSVDHDKIAEMMLVANVNADFINVSERVSARFNVKAAEKVINLARVLASAEHLNHYTRAVFLSAVALAKNNTMLTHKDAHASCSLSVKNNAARDKLLVRYQKHVDASTASTQSSSSINALQMFDVLKETRDESNTIAYVVNTDSEATKRLFKHFNIDASA